MYNGENVPTNAFIVSQMVLVLRLASFGYCNLLFQN